MKENAREDFLYARKRQETQAGHATIYVNIIDTANIRVFIAEKI